MTQKEKQLLESTIEMTFEEVNEIYETFAKNSNNSEFAQKLCDVLSEKVFTDEWWEKEIDFEDALMELDPKYRESLINEDWRELLDT